MPNELYDRSYTIRQYYGGMKGGGGGGNDPFKRCHEEDEMDYVDRYGYTCVHWKVFRDMYATTTGNDTAAASSVKNHNCTVVGLERNYTVEDLEEISSQCPVSCGMCEANWTKRARPTEENSFYVLEHEVYAPPAAAAATRGATKTAYPLLLYFHGWGGDRNECGEICEVARNEGYVTVAMTGMGSSSSRASWNGFGSTERRSRASICKTDTSPNECDVNDCGSDVCDAEDAACFWTTCQDSVGQVVDVLRTIREIYPIDDANIWAMGCSNGGMFLFELASDSRTADIFAGILPVVGLPHRGFNRGPRTSPMHLFGMWGLQDTTCPPLSNTNETDLSLDTSYNGWYYSTARNTTEMWATRGLALCDKEEVTTLARGPTIAESFGGGDDDVETCVTWDLANLSSSSSSSSLQRYPDVVECVFRHGHVCNRPYQYEPAFAFMRDREKIRALDESANTVTPTFEHGVASGDPSGDKIVLWTRVTLRVVSYSDDAGDDDDDEIFLLDSNNCSQAASYGADEFSNVRLRVLDVTNRRDDESSAAADFETTLFDDDDDEGFTFALDEHELTVRCARDWIVKLDVHNLEPGHKYVYQFLASSTTSVATTSDVGHFGLFDDSVASLRFAVFSCASWGYGWFHSYRHASEVDDLDFWMQVGDYIYDYDPHGDYVVRVGDPGLLAYADRLDTLDEYRKRYMTYHADADLQRLRARAPLISSWDDHEFANDAWVHGAAAHDEDVDGPWETRKRAAAVAYEEWIPIRPRNASAIVRRRALSVSPSSDAEDMLGLESEDPRYDIERVFDFGRLARLVLPESRVTNRSNPYDGGGSSSYGWGSNLNKVKALLADTPDAMTTSLAWTPELLERLDALALDVDAHANVENRTIYGDKQLAWIERKIRESETTWQIFAQQQVVQPCFLGNLTEIAGRNPKWNEIYRNATEMPLNSSNADSPSSPPPTLVVQSPLHAFDDSRDTPEPVSENMRRLLLEYKAASDHGVRLNFDGWNGYEAERGRFLEMLRASGKSSRVVVLGGDSHNSWAGTLRSPAADADDKSDEEEVLAAEFDGPGTTSPGLEKSFKYYPADMLAAGYVARNAKTGMVYADTSRKGYMLFEVTAENVHGEYVYVDVGAVTSSYETDILSRVECDALDYGADSRDLVVGHSPCYVSETSGANDNANSSKKSPVVSVVFVFSIVFVFAVFAGAYYYYRQEHRSAFRSESKKRGTERSDRGDVEASSTRVLTCCRVFARCCGLFAYAPLDNDNAAAIVDSSAASHGTSGPRRRTSSGESPPIMLVEMSYKGGAGRSDGGGVRGGEGGDDRELGVEEERWRTTARGTFVI
eukprot:g3945.t1